MRIEFRRPLLAAIAGTCAACALPAAPVREGTDALETTSIAALVRTLHAELAIRPAAAGKRSNKRRSKKGQDDDDVSGIGSSGGGSSSGPSGFASTVTSTKSSSPKQTSTGKATAKSTVKTGKGTTQGAAPPATVQELISQPAQAPTPKRRGSPSLEDLQRHAEGFDGSEVTVASEEFLASGLDSAAIRKAHDLGFETVGSARLPTLGLDVTKLAAPRNMGRNIAHELLREHVVRGGFQSNNTHVIYAPSDGTENALPDQQGAPGQRAGQCREDRCFGRVAICWSSDVAQRAAHRKIGIIDTPIETTHPAFAGRRISVGSFTGRHVRSSRDWHGTAVLSVLSGSLDSGTPGLLPDAEYFVAEAFRTDEAGVATTDTTAILTSLDWLESQGVTLVNLSFSGPRDALVEKAIARMQQRGVVFIAAAGNLGPTAAPSYPAAYKDVIAVTAVAKGGSNYFNANRGDYIDLSAPGVKIWTALPEGREGFRTGTSFAAPYVTGILAATLPAKTTAVAKGELLRRVRALDLGPPGADPIYGRGLAQASSTCAGGVALAPARPENDTVSSMQPTEPSPPAAISLPPPFGAFGETVVIPAPSPASAFSP